MVKQGIPRKIIAEKFNISKGRVDEISYKDNCYRTYLNERNQNIVDLYNNGAPFEELAKQFNLSEKSILRILKK